MPPIPPNPWLNHPLHRNPNPANKASFVEYLRWMRILRENPNNNSQVKLVNNGEVLQLLEKLLSNSDYSDRLKQLTQRTRQMAEVCFEAKANWRVRVGGMRGPESMLLPAFDALGMPYIPSTTLKGVARAMAELELTTKEPPITPEQVRDIFGEIEPTACMGKVFFLDAYPLPFVDTEDVDEMEGLVPDMANSIWTWDGNIPQYSTNPNVFLSLRKPTFVIGLRLVNGADPSLLEHVQRWLFKGLAQGIGSQVNSGYGTFEIINPQEQPKKAKEIVSVKFQLRGQLIHGRQYFNNWNPKPNNPNEWKPPGIAQSEIRPPAFRSMLRYWFRTLALGVLDAGIVKDWELTIFGGIDPVRMGMFQLEIDNARIVRDNASSSDKECGFATGTLIIRRSPIFKNLSSEQQQALQKFLASLTWLTFHLGGVGQGARRPCYSRQNRDRAPWWRGSSVKLITLSPENKYWNCPREIGDFQRLFHSRLNSFYTNLSTITGQNCDSTQPKTASKNGNWAEAVDSNCRIICVKGDVNNKKPPALSLLHREAWNGRVYEAELCGSMKERSPIWIARVGSPFDNDTGFANQGFDVVTIFGVDNQRRREFFNLLTTQSRSIPEYREIWTPS
jgi:CRISPR-associated protein Cmr6